MNNTTKNDRVIVNEAGMAVKAHFPLIVSASRSTDIPAFYADWFFHRLSIGYSVWTNPFSGVKSYISYQDTRFVVFWSKNPENLIPHLDYLRERGIGCYVQYTLNDYVAEGLEKGVPSVQKRIDTFKRLVDKLGKGGVIWRFDPLMLTDNITVDDLVGKIEGIGNQLFGYTEKLVFSFVDIREYRRVRVNLDRNGVKYSEWSASQMLEFAAKLEKLNERWGYTLATCGERVDLSEFGVVHNKCIDDDLIIRRVPDDEVLMKHLGVSIEYPGMFGVRENSIDLGDGRFAVKSNSKKDKGQRPFCGCIASKDIGEYNTCAHLCEYCYANNSKEAALANLERHRSNPLGETITGI